MTVQSCWIGARCGLLTAAMGLLVAAVLAIASPAAADSRVYGKGVVISKDLLAGTMQIDGATFVVGPGTTFEDLDGNALSFEAFDVVSAKGRIVATADTTIVEWVAESDGARLVLVSVKRVREVPR